jgi:dihydrofolate reductase
VRRPFAIVVAADAHGGIGQGGTLPWRLPGELSYFKRLTSAAPTGQRNAVVMGRKTYASVAPKFRPLAGRLNVVLSRDPAHRVEGALAARSLDEALAHTDADAEVAQVFVIGGGAVYRDALSHPRCGRVYLTRVHASFACDTFLAPLSPRFTLAASDGPHQEGALTYTFEVHEPSPEIP